MEKLTFTIKVEMEHSVEKGKLEHLEEQLEHKATQLGNLMATKVREAVKMANGEISKPKITKTFSVKKKVTKKKTKKS